MPPINNRKTIITVHDLAFVRHPEYIEPKNLKFLMAELPLSLEKAARIIAVSQFTKNELIDVFKVPPEKISVIYEGVDPKFKKTKKSLKILPEKYVLCLGNLEPRKNIEGLVRAFNMLKLKDYKLVIAGEKGWLYDGVFKLIEELGLGKDVVFTGYIGDHDLPAVYSKASVFVFPSFYEGFGLPPLEAMACSVPVVASKVNEVLGEAALFIDPKKPEDIVQAIDKVINNPGISEELISKGKKQAEKYSWDKTAKETLSLYRKLDNN